MYREIVEELNYSLLIMISAQLLLPGQNIVINYVNRILEIRKMQMMIIFPTPHRLNQFSINLFKSCRDQQINNYKKYF